LKAQIKSAMFYPIAILIVAIGVICVMMIKVIPTFKDMYKQMGPKAKLPAPTEMVMSMSNAFVANWYFIIGGMLGFVIGLVMFRGTRRGREIFDRMRLPIPVTGPTLRKIVAARFTRPLGTLLSSGVRILDALDICAKTAGNVVVQAGIMRARDKISEGHDMA